MQRRRRHCVGGVSVQLVWVVVVLVWSWRMLVEAQQAPKTDPIEVAALNTIFGRWGLKASSEWNISGDPCSGFASDGTNWDHYPNITPFIKCVCSYNNNTVCHITRLRLRELNVIGPIPSELQNLTYLVNLDMGRNYLTGAIPPFIGTFSQMQYLSLGSSALSGPLPKELGNLTNLISLGLSMSNFTGELPEELGNMTSLQQMYVEGCGLSGPLPSTFSKLKNLKILRVSDNEFTGKIPDYLGSLPNLEELAFHGNSFEGPIPESLSNLTKLTTLRLGDIVNGSSSLAFISNLASLSLLISGNLGAVDFSMFAKLVSLDLSFNNITGQIPQSLLNLGNIQSLFLGNNSLTGRLPEVISSSLKTIDLSYNQLNGSLPSWATQNNLQLGSDGTIYEVDPVDLGAASYYVSRQTRWAVSNVGQYYLAPKAKNIVYSPLHFQNSDDSKLFETARMSASSLRYYGLRLENGNYTVLLQFAEFAFPDTKTWQSLGRRVFDIYVQGHLKEKNFDIRKTAGTYRIPTEGYYGPMISAISISPNFTPTVRNGVPKRRRKAGVIAGILIGVLVLGLLVTFGIFLLVKKRRTTAQQKELYNLVGRPDVFSYAELKLATNNFSSQNILGEGGYGPVYKGKLPDGKDIAVKQLSQSSHQGKSEFVTEVETISVVQHRNLVKLHGFCIDGKTPLLVYEYLENGSLDRALFGNNSLILDWAMRFEIILGIARGLTYLHEESSVRIVHRDIKASNVLLDTDLTPKISDFGLAKLYDESQTHVSTKIAGTMGYVAPEYAMRGRLTEKADIFAFGVVMLEIVAGRPNTDNSLEEGKIYLFEWLWSLYEKAQALGIVDPNLNEFNKVEAFRVICVALLCTQGSPHQRPPMSKVVAMLTGEAEVAEVVMKPSYINEWLLRGGIFGNQSYSGFTSSDFSTNIESKHLTQSATITGAGHG
ncbi:hypothetical protein GUJ93_ZPchr0005g14280 [Zizania palustris]|uniref:non-specific serine/threonine protein kinase n=1 Tax=Zizania palustris TaxID=103762 RepID=A0A8J5S9J3_ZIZPA|nr:hypothetical protein GUJ93_ZPchr0005g14280 [Zizania palustris]